MFTFECLFILIGMKRHLLLFAAAIGFASASYGQTSYGVKAGVNLPTIKFSGPGLNHNSKSLTGFHLTGYADIKLMTNLSIQPGLSLQNKGGKINFYDLIKSIDFTKVEGDFEIAGQDIDLENVEGSEILKDIEPTISTMYMEVPINFVYYISAGNGDVLLGAGPYAAYGVSARTKLQDYNESGSFDEAGMKAFDAGLNVMAGYKLANGFLVNAGYGLGLLNTSKESDSKYSNKNRVLSFGIGYQF